MPKVWVKGDIIFEPEVGELFLEAGDIVCRVTVEEESLADKSRCSATLGHHPVPAFNEEATEIFLDVRVSGTVVIFKLLERNRRLDAEVEDHFARSFVKTKVLGILRKCCCVLGEIVSLGNRLRGGPVIIGDTYTVGVGFVK